MNSLDGHQISNSPWFGQIPSQWKAKRLKYLTKPRKELSQTGEEELLSVTEIRGIAKRRELRSSEESLSRSENLTGYRHVKKGDLVSNIMLVWKRGLGVSPYDGIVSPAYSVFTFSDECYPGYYNYLLRSDEYITEFRKQSTGIIMSRLRLYDDSFGTVLAHLPPLDEQKLISRYLDKKTEQIDLLVEKIQKKIELLKEQRTSLINHIVTKGLDPNVEMKDSGIEWIDEIPKHWEVKKISTLYSKSTIKGYEDEENLSVFRDYGVVRRDDFDNKNVLSEDLSSYKLVNKGDLVLNKMKTWMGSLGVSEYRGIVSPAYYVLKPNFDFFSGYLHNLLRSKIYIDQYALVSKGIRPGQWDLSFDEFKSLKIILPPINEQIEIHSILTRKLEVNRHLSELENLRTKKLKEYSQSLISSIVTGKVRLTEDMI